MACTCKIFQEMTEKNNLKIVYINDIVWKLSALSLP